MAGLYVDDDRERKFVLRASHTFFDLLLFFNRSNNNDKKKTIAGSQQLQKMHLDSVKPVSKRTLKMSADLCPIKYFDFYFIHIFFHRHFSMLLCVFFFLFFIQNRIKETKCYELNEYIYKKKEKQQQQRQQLQQQQQPQR